MNPEAVAGLYVGEITTGLNIHKPEYLLDLFRRRGHQGLNYFMLVEMLGWSRPVAQDDYFSFEDNWIHETFHSLAQVAAPGAGNDANVTLDPRDLDGGNRYYPQVGDQVLFPNEVYGRIQVIDPTNPAAPILTISPNDATDDIGLIEAGQELIIVSNSYGEGGGQPLSRIRGAYRYSNDCQIIKSTVGATGSELTRQSWVEVWSDDGTKRLGYYNLTADADMSFRHTLAISGAMMVGKRTTNPAVVDTDPESGAPILTTEGLIPYTRRRGNPLPLADGAFDITTLDTIDRLLNREYAAQQVLFLLGDKRYQDVENSVASYLQNTNVSFTRDEMAEYLFNGDKAKAVALNFTSLVKSQRTFHLQRMNDFHNPKTFGADGYKFDNMGIILPLDKKRDVKSGEPLPSIGVRYRELGGYNRRSEIWQDGAAGPGLKIGQLDKKKTYMRSHMGAHFRGGNQFVIIYEP